MSSLYWGKLKVENVKWEIWSHFIAFNVYFLFLSPLCTEICCSAPLSISSVLLWLFSFMNLSVPCWFSFVWLFLPFVAWPVPLPSRCRYMSPLVQLSLSLAPSAYLHPGEVMLRQVRVLRKWEWDPRMFSLLRTGNEESMDTVRERKWFSTWNGAA